MYGNSSGEPLPYDIHQHAIDKIVYVARREGAAHARASHHGQMLDQYRRNVLEDGLERRVLIAGYATIFTVLLVFGLVVWLIQ